MEDMLILLMFVVVFFSPVWVPHLLMEGLGRLLLLTKSEEERTRILKEIEEEKEND